MEDKYLIRHKILEVLRGYEQQLDNQENPSFEDLRLSVNDVANRGKLSTNQIVNHLDFLVKQNELLVNWDQGAQYLVLLRDGAVAYSDKKYLNEGYKELIAKETSELQKENLILQNEKFEYTKTIRNQEQQIRDLDHSLKTAEAFKTFWWAFTGGGLIVGYLLNMLT
ncbi:hypothetical protein I0P70_13630 [Pontibacter sp. FD36]|uniref:hypothetical protein n=1 Tax=Pontibacter sp. FD36 TaxID=2789860 RepID=UPI0018AA9F3F|nr:hypothetical protein [Pontibacter sp. FD36]MBF8964290.1 hypothetical protein [Pontibacter sp. FD36]